jgi:hypothetical protein
MSKVSKRGGKITVSIPINDFIDEHKSIVKILNEGVPEKVIAEAENQRKELKDIIEKAKRIQMNKPTMNSDEVMSKLVDIHSDKERMERRERALAQLRKVEADTKERNIARRETMMMREEKKANDEVLNKIVDGEKREEKMDVDELINLVESDGTITYNQLRKIASDNNITMSGKTVSTKENVKRALLAGLRKKQDTIYEDL